MLPCPLFVLKHLLIMAEELKQPDLEAQELEDSILENTPEVFQFREGDRKWRVGWTYYGSLRKVSHLMVSKEEDEGKVVTKCAAALLCDSVWKQWFVYWLLWRWMYYIKQYTDAELLPLLKLAQKKIPLVEYSSCIMLLTGMKDTMMAMTRKELGSMLQERGTAQPTP